MRRVVQARAAHPLACVSVAARLVLRRMVAARIVRMGYNLLSLDDDIMLHHSIYNFLKLPELANITLWASTEADSLLMHPTMHINCGVMYWNGADPSGPAAWGVGMLGEYFPGPGRTDCVCAAAIAGGMEGWGGACGGPVCWARAASANQRFETTRPPQRTT